MNIDTYGATVRTANARIVLNESDRFDFTYDGWNRAERGIKMQVISLVAHVDLTDGLVDFTAYGNLYTKAGKVGQRPRTSSIPAEEVPEEARGLAIAAFNSLRDRIAAATLHLTPEV